ncbi:DUF3515 family protein [Subtercola boreus]|uniref:DUF3515 domain-containing protein n=1 Tax=Subtercola boreus TaxID=120213 RepID=A0A3E0WF45_9MICO|nr:hypothetical protein B7R24_04390 [Subtercola boreus]RFA22450.1 hypothetical protein B7R23_04385 [Subtercola boreus]RFA28465.1 hypothetical protein B7R25_04400 [Subtercola boreus]
MFHRKRVLLPGALVAGLLATLVSGCAPTVALDPAADATNPGCAEIMVRLPTTVADEPSRETNAQATAAWGSPAAVLLRCGVAEYGPTTLPCVRISGIDWVEDDSQKPSYTYTTFGRSPATQVIVDSNAVSASTALIDLQTAVAAVPQTSVCTSPDEILGTGANSSNTDPTSTPTPATETPAPTVPTDSGAPFVIETAPPTP